MNWAIRTAKGRDAFVELIRDKDRPDRAMVRYEPALSRVVDFAIGDGLVASESGGAILLTPKGIALADKIIAMDDCLVEEKRFLLQLGGKVSQRRIEELLNRRRLL